MQREGALKSAPKPIIVVPTPDQLEFARRLGRLRAKKYEGRTDAWGQGSRSGICDEGALGEIVFADWMNERLGKTVFQINETIYEDGRGDPGWDFQVKLPWSEEPDRIDVKVSRLDALLVPRIRSGSIVTIKANLFVPVQIASENEMRILGWQKKDELEDCSRSRRFDNLHNLTAKPDQLETMLSLVTRYKGGLCL